MNINRIITRHNQNENYILENNNKDFLVGCAISTYDFAKVSSAIANLK